MTFPVFKARRHALAALLCSTLSHFAWAQTSPATAEPIRIGMIEGLSGPFANTGEAVARNIGWAIERINARGGVRTAQGPRPLELLRFDNKGQTEESLAMLRAAVDRGAQFVLQV